MINRDKTLKFIFTSRKKYSNLIGPLVGVIYSSVGSLAVIGWMEGMSGSGWPANIPDYVMITGFTFGLPAAVTGFLLMNLFSVLSAGGENSLTNACVVNTLLWAGIGYGAQRGIQSIKSKIKARRARRGKEKRVRQFKNGDKILKNTPTKKRRKYTGLICALIGALYGTVGSLGAIAWIGGWSSSAAWPLDIPDSLALPGLTICFPAAFTCNYFILPDDFLIKLTEGSRFVLALVANTFLWAGIGYGIQRMIQKMKRKRRAKTHKM